MFGCVCADPRDTLQLGKMIESTGVSAVAVHARHVEDRPRHCASSDGVRILSEALSIPVIYNGDVFSHSDIARLRGVSGAASVMIARGAMWNPSIFRSAAQGGFAPLYEVAQRFVTLAEQYRLHWSDVKYTLQQLFKDCLLYTSDAADE